MTVHAKYAPGFDFSHLYYEIDNRTDSVIFVSARKIKISSKHFAYRFIGISYVPKSEEDSVFVTPGSDRNLTMYWYDTTSYVRMKHLVTDSSVESLKAMMRDEVLSIDAFGIFQNGSPLIADTLEFVQ